MINLWYTVVGKYRYRQMQEEQRCSSCFYLKAGKNPLTAKNWSSTTFLLKKNES